MVSLITICRPSRWETPRPIAPLVLLLGLTLCGGGCATATLETLGAVAGVASSAATTGREVYGLGKLDTAEMARLDEAVAAARAAAVDLGLHPKPQRDGNQQRDQTLVELAFLDDKCAWLRVRVDRRAATLVRIRIDVGLFGSEPTAHLFLARLRAHLPRPSPAESQPLRN